MKWPNGYRIRLLLLGGVAGLALGSACTKADVVWAQKADMPTTRYMHSTSVVGGKIYAIGGWGAQWGALTRVDEYDPAAGTWTKKTDMPTARGYTSTCVVNDKVYVIGGDAAGYISGISAVEVYDPATDTWTRRSNHPTRRIWHSTSVVDGIIYVIGAAVRNESEGWTYHYGTVEAYDPSTDTWTPKADMPTGRSLLTTCVVDGIIYAIGGWATALATVEAYDPRTDTWTKKASMPTARYLLDAVVVDGKIYVIGGYHHSIQGPIYSTVEAYDPETDNWMTELDIPTTLAGMSASVVDGKIYVIGGTVATHPGGNWVFTSAVYADDVIADFNGDGKADGKDVLAMANHWGTDDSLFDIGPMPWGDDVVDLEDLKVLAEYIEKPIVDGTLVAHWALDEAEGLVAHDSACDNDGTVAGDPLWNPDGGAVAGALALGGATFVSADFALNPNEGPFSVLAWVKGGAPGQVVLSQEGGTDWLALDPTTGALMSGLHSGSRLSRALYSDAVIADDAWHRVGFTWDGFSRSLYVDDILVAEGGDIGLAECYGGFNIGCGKSAAPDTFFTGLIDDVRIYNRAVRP